MLSVKLTKRLDPGGGRPGRADSFGLDVEFHVPAGVTILFGPSGSGKTLTLRAIAGLIRPDAGAITVNDRTLFDSARRIDLPIRLRGAGYVFQNLALFPHLTALGNIEFAVRASGSRERRERALALMRSFHIEHAAGRRPRHISGGEAQRVALARALAAGPEFLLLDEPLSALDEATKLGVIADLKRINAELRLPILYVTHSREEAVTLGQRAVVYDGGRIVAAGEPLEVFGAPVNAGVARLTGVENVFEGRVAGKDYSAGTMTVEIGPEGGACRLEVPLGSRDEGSPVIVAVRSGDVLLSAEELRRTSARNVLRGRIARIDERGDQMLVRVESGALLWAVSVTKQSARELELSVGRDVWLAIKTYSCHLLDGAG